MFRVYDFLLECFEMACDRASECAERADLTDTGEQAD